MLPDSNSNIVFKIVNDFSNFDNNKIIDNGVFIEDSIIGKVVYIDSNFYGSNKSKINEMIINYIKDYKGEEITISSQDLITPEVLVELSKNNYIKTINLGSYGDKYLLSKDDYEVLITNHNINKIITYGVTNDLNDYEDSRIEYNSCKSVLIDYMFEDLVTLKYITIDKTLSDEEIAYLKYIPIGSDILIDFASCNNSEKIIDILVELGHKVTIKNFVFKTKYLDLKYQQKILIEDSRDTINLSAYVIKMVNNIFDVFLKDINDSGLSPLERFICVYNITKKFKQYCGLDEEEDIKNLQESRSVYKIVFNDFMVCEGYANMLEKLCFKLGIYTEKVECVFKEDLLDYESSHAIVAVKIKDDKYNIDSVFYSDPTADNYLIEDYYNFVLYPPYQRKIVYSELETSYSLLENDSEIAFANDYLKRPSSMLDLINLLKNIDKEFIDKLKKKYGDLEKCSNEEIIYNKQIMYELCEYVKRNNHLLDFNILISAIREVLRFTYPTLTEEIINEQLNLTIIQNQKRQRDNFGFIPDIFPDLIDKNIVKK